MEADGRTAASNKRTGEGNPKSCKGIKKEYVTADLAGMLILKMEVRPWGIASIQGKTQPQCVLRNKHSVNYCDLYE